MWHIKKMIKQHDHYTGAPCARVSERPLKMCSLVTQHNAKDVLCFQGVFKWHADCRNVHHSLCQRISCSFLYHKLPTGPPKWRSSLRHCIAVLEASLQIRVWSRAVSHPARTGGPMACMALGLYRVRMGLAAMGQDCNYQLEITKFGRKRGKHFFK